MSISQPLYTMRHAFNRWKSTTKRWQPTPGYQWCVSDWNLQWLNLLFRPAVKRFPRGQPATLAACAFLLVLLFHGASEAASHRALQSPSDVPSSSPSRFHRMSQQAVREASVRFRRPKLKFLSSQTSVTRSLHVRHLEALQAANGVLQRRATAVNSPPSSHSHEKLLQSSFFKLKRGAAWRRTRSSLRLLSSVHPLAKKTLPHWAEPATARDASGGAREPEAESHLLTKYHSIISRGGVGSETRPQPSRVSDGGVWRASSLPARYRVLPVAWLPLSKNHASAVVSRRVSDPSRRSSETSSSAAATSDDSELEVPRRLLKSLPLRHAKSRPLAGAPATATGFAASGDESGRAVRWQNQGAETSNQRRYKASVDGKSEADTTAGSETASARGGETASSVPSGRVAGRHPQPPPPPPPPPPPSSCEKDRAVAAMFNSTTAFAYLFAASGENVGFVVRLQRASARTCSFQIVLQASAPPSHAALTSGPIFCNRAPHTFHSYPLINAYSVCESDAKLPCGAANVTVFDQGGISIAAGGGFTERRVVDGAPSLCEAMLDDVEAASFLTPDMRR